jgi:DNA primase
LRFSAEFIEQVRESTNLLELIGQHVQLQRAGSSYRGLCPFPGHLEKTPSFFVSDTKQLYHCFGCQKSGTAYNFLMDFQGLTFVEAVEYLATRAHISIPELEKKFATASPTGGGREERAVYLKLNRYVGSLFQKNLQGKSADHPVTKYIGNRGLTPEIILEFKLGYSEPGWGDLVATLKRGRAPLEGAAKLGLVKRKANEEYFDIFRDRLMFPILAANGEVLGFGGRSLGDQQPKYLNSPESPLFHKGRTLYGLHATAKFVRAKDEVYVVEGYMDLLALYQFGIKNVVATLGTAFTADHGKAIQKLCSKVVVLFDGDDAGLVAADKSLPHILDAGLFARCLTLPESLDPDDFLRKYGVEEFLKKSKEAPDHFLSFLGRQMKDYAARPTEKVAILNTLSPILERVRDQRLRILYLQEVADRLGVGLSWLEQQFKVARTQLSENKQKNDNISAVEKIPREEEILVRFMLQNRKYLERVSSSGIVEKFASREAQVIGQRIVERYCQNPNDFDTLAASLIIQDRPSAVTTNLLSGHIATEVGMDEANELQLLNDCIARVKERDFKIKSKQILNALKIDPNSSSASSSEKLEVLLKIAQEQKGPRDI